MLTLDDWIKDYEMIPASNGQIMVKSKGKLLGSFDTEEQAKEYIERSAKIDLNCASRNPRKGK